MNSLEPTTLTVPKKKGTRGLETECLTDLKRSFQSFGAFFFKIPDMAGIVRFVTPKPFDVTASAMGVPIAIEGKATREWVSFGISNLRENQVEGLDLFSSGTARGVSMAVLFVCEPKQPPVMVWMSWRKYKAKWLACERLSKSDVAALQSRIVARRVVLKEKIDARGRKVRTYCWYYDLWPFLKDCLSEHAERLQETLRLEESSGALVLRRYYGCAQHPTSTTLPRSE